MLMEIYIVGRRYTLQTGVRGLVGNVKYPVFLVIKLPLLHVLESLTINCHICQLPVTLLIIMIYVLHLILILNRNKNLTVCLLDLPVI